MSSADLWSHHNKLLDTVWITSNDRQDQLPTDLQHYLNNATMNLDENLLICWNELYKNMYPMLHPIAKQFLSIVVTSVPAERLFLKAGNIST